MPSSRPLAGRTAAIVSVLGGGALFLVIVAIALTLFSNLRSVERSLPEYGHTDLFALQAGVRDAQFLSDMIVAAKHAPDNDAIRQRLVAALDFNFIRYFQQDLSDLQEKYPGYEEFVERFRSFLLRLDGSVSEAGSLQQAGMEEYDREIHELRSDLLVLYHAANAANQEGLLGAQASIERLNHAFLAVFVLLMGLTIGACLLWLQRQRALGRLEYLVCHDPLTHLLNRRWLLGEGDAWLVQNSVKGVWALVLFDLDRFKEVNDNFGHAMGDELLALIGKRLRETAPTDSAIVRFGGDEFVLLLTGDDEGKIFGRLETVQAALARPFHIGDLQFRTEISFGIALAPEDGSVVSDLLLKADFALREAKRTQSHSVRYSQALGEAYREKLALRSRIEAALENGEFFLEWQPQFDLATGRMVGAEALLRWRDPVLNKVRLPGEFIPVSEETNLIILIDRYVIGEALKDARQLVQEIGPRFECAVNLSAKHLQEQGLPDRLFESLAAFGLSPSNLRFEITESALIHDARAAFGNLDRLNKAGIKFSLDDFGTGYASLNFLVNSCIDQVKIDRFFISDVLTSERKRAVVTSVVELSARLGLDCVAEGIEDQQQVDFLRARQCPRGQGFHLAKPMSRDDLIGLARSGAFADLTTVGEFASDD
ncbi:putative bifunctional diguanylate cyclase/phosphodiesterase [Amorphus orientalis]|uniref:Diguanylate cyclase (GGDEF)-like protein n=1 Tax=Amorphus orientalis TaxID=649198 RepID=A0AAE4AS19_9HYPH|nr:bifunctional diguanylate cyclase/phosphodiesterase [Amorphus orientalis]MDQ0314758.1 diguanylate cyclase (GGDEF)-like protein [Amorphus orientalis]